MTRSGHLVRDANQIARAFAVYSDNEAVAATRQHLLEFWDLPMRSNAQQLVNDPGLTDIARRALETLTKR